MEPEDHHVEQGQDSENTVKNSVEPPPAPVGEIITPLTGQYRGLKPWRKGQTGNAGGRPKKPPLTEALQIQLSKKAPEDIVMKLSLGAQKIIGKRPTMAQLVSWMLIQAALTGDASARRILFDRIEGRAPMMVHEEDGGMLDQFVSALHAGGVPVGGVNEDDPQ